MADPETLSFEDLRSVLRVAYRGNQQGAPPAGRAGDRGSPGPALPQGPHRLRNFEEATARAERVVGGAIFEPSRRTSQPGVLTAEGTAFCAGALEMLDVFDKTVAQARAIGRDGALRRDRQGVVQVGLLLPAAAELTQPILHAFKSSNPSVRLVVSDLSDWGGELALLRGDVDVAFLWTPVTRERLAVVNLFDDSVSALLSSAHHLATRTSLRPSDLAEEQFTSSVTMSTQWRQASMLSPWREHPEHAVEVLGPLDALAAITSGRAVSLGPSSLGRSNPTPGLRVVPMQIPGGPSAVMCARRTDTRTLTGTFLDIGREVARRLGPLMLPRPRACDRREATTGTLTQAPAPALSEREREVLAALSSGWTAQHIGHALGISSTTVRKHLEHVYTKLGTHDRLTSVNRARELGLLPR